jgi:hypothetical protein
MSTAKWHRPTPEEEEEVKKRFIRKREKMIIGEGLLNYLRRNPPSIKVNLNEDDWNSWINTIDKR